MRTNGGGNGNQWGVSGGVWGYLPTRSYNWKCTRTYAIKECKDIIKNVSRSSGNFAALVTAEDAPTHPSTMLHCSTSGSP